MKIGFIGLWTMGRGMASNLLKAGHKVIVNDLAKQIATKHLEAGATWADTPRALAEASDVVFTSLPTPTDVEAVGLGENGLAAGFKKGAAWFDLSTNAVDVVRRLNKMLAEKGIDFLDAPVSGGPPAPPAASLPSGSAATRRFSIAINRCSTRWPIRRVISVRSAPERSRS